MKSIDLVEVVYDNGLTVCVLPRKELERYERSAKSPRAVRNKLIANYRPDVLWREAGTLHYQHLRFMHPKITPGGYLAGGTQLSQLITEADANLVAMRKIVQ